MNRRYHVVIDASETDVSKHGEESVKDFLYGLLTVIGSRTAGHPYAQKRADGISGMVVSDFATVSVHLFVPSKELSVNIYSFNPFDVARARDYFIDFFSVNFRYMKVIDVLIQDEEVIECEEPRCSRRATKIWGGRKVCDDHYNSYRDQEDTRRMIDP